MSTPEKAPAKTAKAKFPREINIVNDTAIDYVVARTFIAKGTKVPVTVNDEDELTRIKTDCNHIVGLLDNYKEAKEPPVRIEEIA